MAKLGVTLFGLGEFRDALKRLPLELQQEARAEVIRTTESAAAELRAVYPAVTGNLRRGVKTHIREKRGETEGEVRSTAPHAHLWEFGTVNRKTEKGWNRGRMPANITRGLIAIRMRKQRALMHALVSIIQRSGDFRITAA